MILGVLIFQSCSIQKRVHMRGWHVTTHHSKNAKPKNSIAKSQQTEKVQRNKSENEITAPVLLNAEPKVWVEKNKNSQKTFFKTKTLQPIT